MNIPNINFIHAYRVAPWRIQRQWISNTLLAVLVLAMVAALYLNVTSRTAIAGREIQDLTIAITASQQVSGDLQNQLALLTSSSAFEQRARAIGFRPIEPDELQYLAVPGYVVSPAIDLSSNAIPQLSALTIPPEYNQSLLDWFDQTISTSRRARQEQ
jgi:hypothetical protein